MSSDSSDVSGVREAKQARSRKTRDKLIAALEALLREKSFERIGVAELASRAGCAVGSVYRRFENKDAFIPVLMELAARRMGERMKEMGPIRLHRNGDLKSDLEEVARRTWTILEGEAHLLRCAHIQSRLHDNVDDSAFPAMMAGVRQAIEASLRQRMPDKPEPDRKRLAAWAAYFLATPMIEAALYPDQAPANLIPAGGADIGKTMADLIAMRLGR